MTIAGTDLKTMLLRVPKPLWAFMKSQTIVQEDSLNNIMIKLMEKYKKKCEKSIDAV